MGSVLEGADWSLGRYRLILSSFQISAPQERLYSTWIGYVCAVQQHILLWDWAGEAQPSGSHVVIPASAVFQGAVLFSWAMLGVFLKQQSPGHVGRGRWCQALSVALAHLRIVGEGVTVQRMCLSCVTEPRHFTHMGKRHDRNSPSLQRYCESAPSIFL